MKHIFWTILLFCITVNLKSQEIDIDSVIFTNLNNSHFFEIQELYENNKEQLSPVQLSICESMLTKVFNQPNKSTLLLSQLIKTFENKITPDLVFYLYGQLFINLLETKNNDYYEWACKSISSYINYNPHNLNDDTLGLFKENLDFIKNKYSKILLHPPIKIKRSTYDKDEIPLLSDSFPTISTNINGFAYTTLLDTGVDRCLTINKQTALKMGLNYSTRLAIRNGEQVEIGEGLIDSMQIGTLKIYNIPVEILDFPSLKNMPDSLRKNKDIMRKYEEIKQILKNPIIGLPLLTKIGGIIFDLKNNSILFPQKICLEKNITKHNIFIFKKQLQTKVKINDIYTTLTLDTGCSGFIEISDTFFQKNKSVLPSKKKNSEGTVNIYLHNIEFPQEPDRYLLNPTIKFCNKDIQSDSIETGNQIIINRKDAFMTSNFSKYDGVLGYSFLKSLGNKVLIDFENMNIKILE